MIQMPPDSLGKKSQPALSPEDKRLWEKVKSSVTAIHDSNSQHFVRESKPSDEQSIIADPKIMKRPALAAAKVNVSRKPNVLDRKTKGKIARGRNSLDATIDLHGMRQAEAHKALIRFLTAAQNRGARFVIVITGKGTRKKLEPGIVHSDRGILQSAVPNWFATQEFREIVTGYSEASPAHGGSGALYVQIRQRRSQKI